MLSEVGGGFFDDGLELFNSDDDYARLIVEFFGEGGFNLFCEFGEIFFGCVKKDIAALDVGFNCGEF